MRFLITFVILMMWFPLFSVDLTSDNIPEAEILWQSGKPLVGIKSTDTTKVRPVAVGDKGALLSQLTAVNSSGEYFTVIGQSAEGTINTQIFAEDVSTSSVSSVVQSSEKALYVQPRYRTHGSSTVFDTPIVGDDGCLWTNCYNNEVGIGNIEKVKNYITVGYGTVGNTTEVCISNLNTTGLIRKYYITESFANGTTLYISSSSANDDAGGTGALTIEVKGLDVNYDVLTEEVNLAGQLTAETTNTYIRLDYAKVIKSGSGLTNAGDIYIHRSEITAGVPDTASLTYKKISANQGKSHSASFTVPAGHKFLALKFGIGAGSGKEITAGIYIREYGTDTFYNCFPMVSYQNRINNVCEYPMYLPEKTDIEIRGKTNASTTNIDAEMFYLLIEE